MSLVFSIFLLNALVLAGNCDFCLNAEKEVTETKKSHCHDTKSEKDETEKNTKETSEACCALCLLTPNSEISMSEMQTHLYSFQINHKYFDQNYKSRNLKPTTPPPQILV